MIRCSTMVGILLVAVLSTSGPQTLKAQDVWYLQESGGSST